METDDGGDMSTSVLIQTTLPMWKMLYNPLTALLKDLDNAVDDLHNLLSAFLSFENSFSDIFVPRYNSNFNSISYEEIEKKYFSFTLWFQGSLFYLLTFSHLKTIHGLAVKSQIKILTLVTSHPHLYNQLIFEYLESLKTIQKETKSNKTPESLIKIKHFLKNVVELEDISLSPNYGELTSNNENDLITALIQIIDYILRREINDSLVTNKFINETWNVLIEILNTNSTIQTQIDCMKSLNLILKMNCVSDENIFDTYFITFISSIKDLILDENHLTIEFSKTLQDSFDIFTLTKHDTHVLLNILYLCKMIKINYNNQDLIEKCELVTRKLLIENTFIVNSNCEFIENDLTLIAVQIRNLFRDTTQNSNDIQWNFHLIIDNLLEKIDFKEEESLKVIEQIFIIVVESSYHSGKSLKLNLYRIPTFFNEQLLIKTIQKFIQNIEYDINSLSKIFYYLILLTNVSKKNQILSSYMQFMFGLLSSQIIQHINWKHPDNQMNSILQKFSNDKQNINLNLINILMLTSIHATYDNEYIAGLNRVLKHFTRSNDDNIRLLVFKQIPYLIASGAVSLQSIIAEWLIPVLNNNNQNLFNKLSEILLKIICICGNQYLLVNYYNETKSDLVINYDIICSHCNVEMDTNNRPSYWFNGQLHYIDKCVFIKGSTVTSSMDKRSMEKLFLPFLRIISSTNIDTKINMIYVLTALSFHFPKLITLNIVKKWVALLTNTEPKIRKVACENFHKLIDNIQNCDSLDVKTKEEIIEECTNGLIKSSQMSLQNSVKEFQNAIVESVMNFGCLKNVKNSVLISLKLLIHFALNIRSVVQEFAYIYIEDLAHTMDLTENQFYTEYKKDICKTIIELSVFNYVLQKTSFSSPLHKLVRSFGFINSNDFIVKEGRYLLPYLIPWIVKLPYLRALLDTISDMTLLSSSELIINQFGNIYPHIYLNENDEMYEKCMKYLKAVSKTDDSTLKRKHFRIIFNELLLYFHKNQSRVLSGLKILFQEEIDVQNTTQIINAIQSRFLGLLVYFDSKLSSKRVAISDKRNALQSLPEIIKLIGAKNITPLRFKVMATLHSTLNIGYDEFNKLSCYVWDAFVKNCDIDAIGPLLSTIFTSLLPLYGQFSDIIHDIFRYLVIDHEQDLLEYLPDLFFLTDTNVNNNIKNVIKNALKNYSKMNFRDQLQFYLKYLQHDNIEIRVYGLNFTRQLLEQNRELLNELILGYSGLDPIIVELIDLIITGFREKNKNYYLACSKCIGELGAIEPSHLPKRYTKQNETFTFTINEDNFAFKALNELIRAFQSEKYSQNMDCFALAIQEILKAYNVNSTGDTKTKSIWNNFPENQQQIMQPLLTSRYKIAFQSDKPTDHPLFQSDDTKNFIDWIHRWIAKLIPLIKTDSCRYLFDCCQPSLRKDMQVLMFFLPYILLHSLLEADTNDRKHIYEEMCTVLEAYKNKNNTDERLQFKPLKSDLLRYMPSLPTNEEMTLAQAAKVVYVLLDFLLRWLREWEQQYRPEKSPDNDPQYVKINSFVKKFCKLSVAQSNYNHEEFPRALMYLEDYVNENPNDLENQLGFFTRIYVQLDDPDSVAGIRSIQQQEPLLEDMILSHEISGQLQDATACYERLAQEVRLHPQTLQGLIRCYLDLDNPYTAHRIIEGFDYKTSEFSTNLYECEVETLWRLHEYDKLESVLNNPEIKKMSNWSVNLGNILLNFHEGNQENFWNEISETRCLLVQPFSVSNREEGSYEYGYPQVMKLHLLNELEKVQLLVNHILKSSNDVKACNLMVDKLISEFDQRERLVQSSVRVLEPIYCLRRTALQQAQELLADHPENIRNIFNKHIGNYWVKSAQVARITGMYQQAYINLLNAEKYKPLELFIEKAKLHWARGEQEIAFSILKRGLESTTLNDSTPMRKIIAEAKLLVALYNEETANLDVEANIAKYKEAIDSNKECETSMVYLARYYDKALTSMPGDKDIGLGGDMQLHMIHNFGKSLQYGKEFLYHSMPRMLSIWLDYGSRQVENKDKDSYEIKSLNVLKMTKLISTYLERLPAYMFLSAFSQIVSRICHPQKQVYQQLKSIIVKLIQTYPQQTLWMIMSVYKSSYPVRVKRCQEILQDERLKQITGLVTLIHDFNRLAEKLIDLCNKPISNGVSVTTVSTLIKSLPRLITSSEFSQVMVPVEQYLKMVLPISNELLAEHNPYPKKLVYIIGIDDKVTIMPSLQRPRRITLLGSDGKKYMHMLKPKDDLRKDFRLMEFNGVVNQFLYQESESRQRRLHIRTYAVVPINEECGIIEWVPDLIPFRAIILKLHKQRNSFVSPKELRTMMCNLRDSLQKKKKVYLEQLLPRHPLVFHEWFRQMFSDPHAWYQARTSYLRTTATISIVGYILGLGDRHGENILFDSTNGDTVHVDFNCLFNRGEGLEWPERVPFRLTPNMVKAMGPLGVEGTFRRSCEVTLRVLRSQKDTLMSILKPFVYDPLVDWHKNPHAITLDANAERTNEKARDHVRNIESRLQGIKGGGKLPIRLSVQGHVNSLILDATSIDNLCQMYIGWGSYL